MEIRKIEPEHGERKGKEEEEADQIVPSGLGPQLESLPPPLGMRKLVVPHRETLLAERLQSRKFTVAVGAVRHDSDKVLSEPIVFGVPTQLAVTEVTGPCDLKRKRPRAFLNVAFI